MLTQAEFEEFINYTTKQIDGDILWIEDEDHSPAVEFRVELTSNPGYPIFVKGSYNSVTYSTHSPSGECGLLSDSSMKTLTEL
ncbi:hypothetical protein QHH03_25615 [Aphanizomenon sp. 202]|nr:hypothetical protein [Aphanizomenon sp. 202]